MFKRVHMYLNSCRKNKKYRLFIRFKEYFLNEKYVITTLTLIVDENEKKTNRKNNIT